MYIYTYIYICIYIYIYIHTYIYIQSLRRYEDTCSQIKMVLSPCFRTSVIPSLTPRR